MSLSVVTRFAPSPTGFLHIGGARTALFNWLYAKAKGGSFLLRIEDTDRERSTQSAVEAIFDGLRWLGLDWDGDAVCQFARAAQHREAAETLLARGAAYRCYCTPQELEAMRENAKAAGRPVRYDGTWRDRDPATAPPGVLPAVRLRAPTEGETVVEDHILGRVVFQNRDLDDLIILRSDGTPTYNLSVVVDDHDMRVTHIIRGVDHLTNAARQSQIYRALGWHVPEMAHIPLIHGPDGKKLSKRHGALAVQAYREMGYLPEAVRNYLARLGWSHGDEEIFSTDQMIGWFDLAGIGKSAARFDFAKLESLNGHYLRALEDSRLLDELIAFLPYHPEGARMLRKLDAGLRQGLLAAMPGLKERAKTLADLARGAAFLFADTPLVVNAPAGKVLMEGGRTALAQLLPILETVEPWNASTLEAAVRNASEIRGVKLGQLAQPLRAALTGTTTSPPIFDVMAVLGRAESLTRIRHQTH